MAGNDNVHRRIAAARNAHRNGARVVPSHPDPALLNASGTPSPRAVSKRGYRSLPCIHEGAIKEWCHGCDSSSRHVRDCEKHEACTRAYVSEKVKSCALCDDFSPGRVPWEWISLQKLTRDTITLAGKLPRSFCGVGGVVRSGMIPAAILAASLQMPLWEVGEEGPPLKLRSGNRGKGLNPQGPLLVVDDTLWAGTARARVREALKDVPHVFAVVYVVEGRERQVDYFGQLVGLLHVLQWNWPTNGGIRAWSPWPSRGRGFASDLDGIIVHDHESGGIPGTPFMVPTSTALPLLVTGRGESSRQSTINQLAAIGCKYDRLAMRPDTVPDDSETIARWKASVYAESGCELFFESDRVQARVIHEQCQRAVICPVEERVYQDKG